VSLAATVNQGLRDTPWDLVVIGRGYAALVDCTTRLHSGKLPPATLLVGQPDPWLRYVDHPMGQYPALLALPGNRSDCQPLAEPRRFLSSRRFAELNRLQFIQLLAQTSATVSTGSIESPLQFVRGRWLIPLNRDGESVSISTRCVDLCTGPGHARVFSPGSNRVSGPWVDGIRDAFDISLLQDLVDRTRRRAFVAEDFICAQSVGERVLVVGEGPLAASATEHALRCEAKAVTWVGRPLEMSELSFPDSQRYDGLIHGAQVVRDEGKKLNASINSTPAFAIDAIVQNMTPSSPPLTIVLGQVSGVDDHRATLVRADPFALAELNSRRQMTYAPGTPLSVDFDTLVVSASSENSESERRSAAHLLTSVPKWVSVDGLVPISRFGVFLGLQVPDGSLRVLGTASRNSYLLGRFTSNPPEELAYQSWHDTLCGQARMAGYAMGIAVGAATIAMANDYYSTGVPDACAQTAVLPPCDLRVRRASISEPLTGADLDGQPYSEFPRSV